MRDNDSAPYFDPLFGRLEAIVVAHDYGNPVVDELVAVGAAAARLHGVSPEVMIAYLRRRVHQAPLAAELDEVLRFAPAHYAGSMMEQMERAGAQRADYLLDSIEQEGGAA